MKSKNIIFILISSDSPSGPIKGAYALANLLINSFDVTIVSLKKGPGANSSLDSRVNFCCLADFESNFFGRIKMYKDMLNYAGGRNHAVSLSLTLSADAMNLFCKQSSVICSSIRGNLIKNYNYDYGFFGLLIAFCHLFSLRWFDKVFAMSEAMSKQIYFYSGARSYHINNFIDEAALEPYRRKTPPKNKFKFIFLGSLSKRKQPLLLVDAMRELRQRGILSTLDVVGDGPLLKELQHKIKKYDLKKYIKLHGFVQSPVSILAYADAMILPSLSEGIPRAALEALYVGVPCVLRNVDGNSELINDRINGALFTSNNDLVKAMLVAAKISRTRTKRKSLLPPKYKQSNIIRHYQNYLG
jgi:glycosyltransferase involved in cell wall biosynthesis